jgi:hypothetical protein
LEGKNQSLKPLHGFDAATAAGDGDDAFLRIALLERPVPMALLPTRSTSEENKLDVEPFE